MTDQSIHDPPRAATLPPRPPRRRKPWTAAAALIGAFLLGVGATSLVARRPQVTLASLTPAPINTLTAGSAVALKGRVADVFGKAFVVDDGTGRALIDTGRAGEGSPLVTATETVVVQGRFERGIVHAAAITHSDGRNDLVGPPGPPPPWAGPHEPLAWLAPRT